MNAKKFTFINKVAEEKRSVIATSLTVAEMRIPKDFYYDTIDIIDNLNYDERDLKAMDDIQNLLNSQTPFDKFTNYEEIVRQIIRILHNSGRTVNS